ncbi:saccharopine dehydrogenase family protein [Alteribacillus bidgolensis]|uniref:Lysine 6-dehydrogenase n=1 Tax=Alteribacillus bidgolensis TaxID=930129 RepID=A0A1G8KYU0_9BACI|nr:saccharopine dehydrogenase C-terminal domain-containing protein [Alteribacillus bidgolensis]SDI48695.1 lysine 6-dehydrogenase [Alteribacillus bidgolensis]
MKAAVLGAGLMGKEVARDLLTNPAVTKVALADVEKKKADAAIAPLKDSRLTSVYMDATDEKQLADFIKNFDVVVNALFYTFNETVAKTAIKTGVHACDLGGHIGEATDHILEWKQEAIEAGITYIPDLGVAPGMINILTGYGAGKLDEVENIYLRVGGLPLRPEPPFGYNHVFSIEGVFDHYTDPSLIIRNGELTYVKPLSEIEPIYFEGFGPLEAFHTSGGTSTLPKTFPYVKNLDYKTVRYPGHAEKFKLFVDLKMTDRTYEVDVGGKKVKPREVLREVLAPVVDLKDKDDVVLLRVRTEGIKDDKNTAYEFEMKTVKDRSLNVTAMARATAYTISIAAQMMGSGLIKKRGIFCPEEIVPGKEYIEEMAKRGVVIKETTN